jgi:hypothetical protein
MLWCDRNIWCLNMCSNVRPRNTTRGKPNMIIIWALFALKNNPFAGPERRLLPTILVFTPGCYLLVNSAPKDPRKSCRQRSLACRDAHACPCLCMTMFTTHWHSIGPSAQKFWPRTRRCHRVNQVLGLIWDVSKWGTLFFSYSIAITTTKGRLILRHTNIKNKVKACPVYHPSPRHFHGTPPI